MATKIITKNSSTASAAPLAADLSAGELAINTNDGKLFYKDSGGTVRTLASKDAASGSFATLSASGNATVGGTLGVTGATTLSSTLAVTGTTTLTGAATLTANPTLSAGTANGVLYLNGSKVATSGSALTFDGSNLGVLGTGFLRIDNNGGTSGKGRLNIGNSGYAYVEGFDTGNGGSGAYLSFGLNTEQMRLTSTGLGIGTSSVAFKLDVNGITRVVGGSASSATFGSNQYIRIDTNANGGYTIGAPSAGGITTGYYFTSGTVSYAGGIEYQNTTNTLTLRTNNTVKATLDSSGNLGIGTTSPSSFGKLAVINGDIAISDGYGIRSGTGGSSLLSRGTGAGAPIYLGSGTAGDYLVFNAGGSEKMRLDSSGNLLVGKTSASTTTVGAELRGTGNVNSASASSTNADQTFLAYSTGAAASRFYVDWGGTVHATSTTISAISDQRFKENVQDLDVGLDKIMALKPRKFDWKAGKGKDIKGDRGFIAQEFEQVFPDLVDEWKDPAPEGEEPYKSVRQDLIPVLVKAIQEQQAIIEQLKARLDAANL